MDIFINKSEAYTFKEGKLQKIGKTITTKQVFENFYQVKNDIYRINEGQPPELFLKDCKILTIKKHVFLPKDERLDTVKESYTKALFLHTTPVYQKFLKMKEEFSEPYFDWLIQNAFVTVDKEGVSTLWVKDKNGNIVNKSSEIHNVNNGFSQGFVYKGSLFFVASWRVGRMALTPIFYGKTYIIFQNGYCSFWALCQKENDFEIKPLGAFDGVFKTPNSTILYVKKDFQNYALFKLGDDLKELKEITLDPRKVKQYAWVNGQYQLTNI